MKNTAKTTRREAIRKTFVAGAALAASPVMLSQNASSADAPGALTVPQLGYSFDALEPHIDAQTMQIHHDKHHAAYVTNFNKAITQVPALAGRSVESLLRDLSSVPESVRSVVRNHGGGHANHTLFWLQLKANHGRGPSGELAEAIDKRFGSFSKFQEQFTAAATKQFGSGWAWLSLDAKKELVVESTPNQDTPLSSERVPLLGIDVWEHAYYLKYQNRRPDYVAAFYNIIDWDVVASRFQAAIRG